MFITKNKWLTRYALCCGYLETTNSKRYSITLGHNSGVGYDVKVYDFESHNRIMWETYEHLTEARKIFSQQCQRFNCKRVIPKK